MPGTVRLHRVLRAPPERVYRAFLDADAMAKWLPPNGFTAKMHHQDLRVGGSFRMSFTHFGSGNAHAFGGEYLELTPHARIRYTGVGPDGRLIDREAGGFHARVVQHECDHLVGRLYPTRMRDLTQLGFTSVLFPELDPTADD